MYKILILLLLNSSESDDKAKDVGGTGKSGPCSTGLIAEMIYGCGYIIFPLFAVVACYFGYTEIAIFILPHHYNGKWKTFYFILCLFP